MRDDDHEKSGRDDSEEMPVFSDRDLEDYLDTQEDYPDEEEMVPEEERPPEVYDSFKGRRRSKRSLILVAVLCFGLGILVFAVLFLMKREIKKPPIVAKRIKRPIPALKGEGAAKIPGDVEERGGQEKPSEGGMSEGEPSLTKPSEAPLVSREREVAKKVVVIGETELPKEEREEKIPEAPEKGPVSKGEAETKPQFAKAEEPKVRAAPEEKPSLGRFTVNVGSFKERVRAERFVNELKKKGYEAFVAEATIPRKGTWYRVSLGHFPFPLEEKLRLLPKK
jgi:cell division septation protein DedD